MSEAVSKNRAVFTSLLLIALATFLAYSNMFTAGLITWDDADFTVNNPDVQSFNIKAFFSSFYLGNYPPLTMVSFAIDSFLGNNNPSVYHFTNILLHAMNTILVFGLFTKIQNNKNLALFIALIFALHPMQVESVSWISERKNLICGFFYLLTLIQYVFYIKNPSQKNYLLVAVLTLLALFSKGMAVSLPIGLLAIDIWCKRNFSAKLLLEKVPFFILSVIFGIIAIKAQSSVGFLKTDTHYAFYQKFLFSGEAYLQYILKLIFPYKLSALYPYPVGITSLQIIGLVVLVASVVILVITFKRKNYLIAGGLLFFIGNILFVLQFVAFGAVLMADHYVYLACLGLFYPLLHYLFAFLKQERVFIITSTILCALFGGYTFSRNSVWKNEINFWGDIVKKYPASHIAWNSLGAEYMLRGNYKKAHECIDKAIYLSPAFYKAHYNSGLLFATEKNYNAALRAFDQAIRINVYSKAIIARGKVYYELKEYSKALADANYVIEKEPENSNAYFLIANCFNDLNELDKALTNYNKAIALKSTDPMLFFKRAITFGKQQQFQKCLSDLETATNLLPDFAEAYYWKGVAKVNLNQNPCSDLQKALSLGFTAAQGPITKYCR